MQGACASCGKISGITERRWTKTVDADLAGYMASLVSDLSFAALPISVPSPDLAGTHTGCLGYAPVPHVSDELLHRTHTRFHGGKKKRRAKKTKTGNSDKQQPLAASPKAGSWRRKVEVCFWTGLRQARGTHERNHAFPVSGALLPKFLFIFCF